MTRDQLLQLRDRLVALRDDLFVRLRQEIGAGEISLLGSTAASIVAVDDALAEGEAADPGGNRMGEE